jgi:hypothetical protein
MESTRRGDSVQDELYLSGAARTCPLLPFKCLWGDGTQGKSCIRRRGAAVALAEPRLDHLARASLWPVVVLPMKAWPVLPNKNPLLK